MEYNFFQYCLHLLSALTTRIESTTEIESTAKPDFKFEEGVLVLSKVNFQRAVDDIDFLLVDFYAPWCVFSKYLAPEYAKAAQQLEKEKSPFKLAKVDITVEEELKEQWDIRGYPTLIFFKYGKRLNYTGGLETDRIIEWLAENIGLLPRTLDTVSEVNEFSKNSTVAIGFFKDPKSVLSRQFQYVATNLDDHSFGIVKNANVSSEFNVTDEKIILFKAFDEGKVVYTGEPTEEAIKAFILIQSLPLVVEFNKKTATKIFGGYVKSLLLLFFSKKAGHYEKYEETTKEVAEGFREKVLFLTINTDEDDHVKSLEHIGIKKEKVPAMLAIKLVENNMTKYKPKTTNLSKKWIEKFVGDFAEGKLKKVEESEKYKYKARAEEL